MKSTDLELTIAAQRDPAEFIELYDRYFRRVFGYVRLRVPDEATAEDVTSQVFTVALAQIHTFRGQGSFSAWLFRIAHNAVHDVYRRQKAIHPTDEVMLGLPDPGPGPEEQVLAAECAADIRALLGTLHPDQQNLLALRYGAGLSFREIGHAVGKNQVAVRVSIHRILGDLRRRYSHDT